MARPSSIYCLFDPSNGHLRYIGKTVKTVLVQRLREHINDAKRNPTRHVHFWIRKLLRQGLEPEIDCLEQTSETEQDDAEMWNIAYYRSVGCDLTNLTRGGDGALGMKRSLETRRKMSLARIGRRHTEETKKKLSEVRKGKPGRPHTEASKNKIRAASTLQRHSEETKKGCGNFV